MVKKIGVAVATSVGLGAIIGAGIFVLSGTAIALAGVYSLLAFLLVGIVAVFIALQLGELGSMMPKLKGASYSYVYEAFGSQLGFITGILMYFSFATAISAVALGFGSYASSFFGYPSSDSVPFAIGLIFVLSILNIIGIKKAAKADFGLVMVKLGILFLFVIFAFILAFSGHTGFNLGYFATAASKGSITAIFAASVAIFFAYSGFQSISTFTSDVEGGANKAAKAILYSVVISIIVYFLVAVALMTLAPAAKFTINADPLAFALGYAKAPGYIKSIVDIGAMIATTSATLAMILTSSRVLYQVGKDKLLPKPARKYDRSRDVAVNGVIVSAVIGVVMLFAGNIYTIAAISNFGLLFSYLLTAFALIHFRRIRKVGSFRTPFYPYIPIISIVAIMAFMLGMPKEALLIGVMLIISLIIIYYAIIEIDEKRPVKEKLFS
ncbi:MAG: APC family permease [Candidatus Marsarchaeota archaeon]|nr:APC family permease [Candidatus Marsarchaeota archaeon]MCL5101803.1 APC family permease [Candidatus Marsarchaeota archaeon]